MRAPSFAFFAVLLTFSALSAPALADPPFERHRGGPAPRREHMPAPPRGFWRGDIHHFHEYDIDHWRAGHWVNGFHEGRSGWWWVVSGLWYFYTAPIYPFPDPYLPPTVVIEQAPPAVVGSSTYYYCASPSGYYPYIPQCAVAWQRVVSTPAVGAPVIVQPPIAQPQPAPIYGTREADDRQLNAFGAEFDRLIAERPRNIHAQLRDLEKRVESFRRTLYSRSYNAMDILRDAEDLKERIETQRKGKPKTSAAPVQPGATVVFPPQ